MPFFLKFFEPKTLIAKFYKSTWTPDKDDEFRSDIDSHASTGTGVVTKTCTVTGTASIADANQQANLLVDVADLSWTGVTSTDIRYLVFYENSGAAATDRLVFYIDLTTWIPNGTASSDDIDVEFDENGLYKVTV